MYFLNVDFNFHNTICFSKKNAHKLYNFDHQQKKNNFLIFFATFFRIGDLDEEEDPNETQENGNPKKLVRRLTTINDAETNNFEGSKTSLNGLRLYWQQFYGLIVKRFIYTKRRYLLYGILALMPALQCIIQQVGKHIVHFRHPFLK